MLKGAYACNSEANYTQYCTPQVDKLLAEQSQQADIDKRKAIVWEIERVLAEDVARPIIYHNRSGTCWHSYLKGYVLHENSIYNNWRFGTSGWTSRRDCGPSERANLAVHLLVRLPGSIRCSRPSFNISWCRRTRPTWPASANSRA